MKRIKRLALLLALLMILSLAGCGSGGGASETSADAGAAVTAGGDAGNETASGKASGEAAEPSEALLAAQAQAKAYESDPNAKILRIGCTASGGGFHPTNHGDTLATYLIYDSPVRVDNGKCELLLAESITWVDPLTCEVKVRDDATFNNGEKILGEDLLYAFKINAVGMMASNFTSVDLDNCYVKDDGMTVVFKLFNEYGPFEQYALEMPCLVDKSVCESWSDSDARWWDQPVSSGPYRIAENVSGSHLTLVKRDDYWDKEHMPEWDEIIIHYYSEQTAMFVAFENGDLDIVLNLLPNDYNRVVEGNVKNAENVEYGTVGYNANYCITMNLNRPEFNDPKVREAIAYAVNGDSVGEVAFGGMYNLPNSVLAPNTLYYKETGGYPFDLEHAKQCMAESGYPNGFSAEVICTSGESLLWEVLQSNLAQIGINVTISSYDMLTSIMMLMDGQGDMMAFCPQGGNKFCEPYVELSSACDDAGLPVTKITDPAYNEVFDAALYSTDPAVREENYAKVQDWLHDNFFNIPVIEPTYAYAYRTENIGSVELDSVINPNVLDIHPAK